MKRILIHAGMPKTGTTAVQKTLAARRDVLSNRGVLYPHEGAYGSQPFVHHALFMALLEPKHRQHFLRPLPVPPRSFVEYVARLLQEADYAESEYLVLSSEFLWIPRVFDPGVLRRIRESLEGHRIDFLIALRDPTEHAKSGYRQLVNHRARLFSGTPHQYIDYEIERGMYSYRSRLDEFRDVFGEDSVHAFWFEDARDDILAPLLALIPTARADADTVAAPTNVSASWAETRVQRTGNRMAGRYPRARSLADYAARKAAGSRVVQAIPHDAFSPFTRGDVRRLQWVAQQQRQSVGLLSPWWT